MNFNGVFHQAYDNYCYPLNEDELIINIKTGYDVKEVNIIWGELGWREEANCFQKETEKSAVVDHDSKT